MHLGTGVSQPLFIDHRTMKRFVILFPVVLIVAFGLIYLPPIRENVIGPFTEAITVFSGWLIQLFGGEVTVSGNILTIPGFSVRIIDMCNGVEATLILWGAILAFPAGWVYKLKGLLIGALTVHALNILRIISLLYLGVHKPEWFHWVHWYLWDALIMIDILIVFLAWVRLMPVPERSQTRETSFA